MLYIDIKYINLVGAQLRNFKKKKHNLFNCSCPLCGDSSKKKTKARGYFYEHKNSMFYKCHNCTTAMSFGYFLKSNYKPLYDSYALEAYKEVPIKSKTKVVVDTSKKINFDSLKKRATAKNVSKNIKSIGSLDEAHFAKRYVVNRNIPEEHHRRLFFTEDFASLVKCVFPEYDRPLRSNDVRLLLPFFDVNKKLIGIQGRSFEADATLRYITIKRDGVKDFLFGIERFDKRKAGYVVEGPIDSLFLNNCVATANSNLDYACHVLDSDLTIVYDNEPKNVQIVKSMNNCIERDRKICIWPTSIKHKDVNDIISSGMSREELMRIIDENTFRGLEAKLKFTQWKRI